ncbi:target of Nesh-SH3 isoform X4 [Dendrobates tinctorius]|uniref:target of Nesh-SH3 isoform X4 n=1 Tax=Dendrobates tinctorius TaxID=92724 RepID=UPI003CCA0077
MISRISFLLFCGIILSDPGDAQKLPKVKKLNMKAHINITGDTLTMKFHRPNQNIKLEGFILGYGSNYFSNQYIQWPDNGKSYITDVDAETRYLIAVKPNDNPKKSCKDKNSNQKPLQLVIGTLTPTSVFLSWGILINPQVDWSALSKCPNGRFYTVRHREKNKDWNYQLCPTTETVIDNLKPNTLYEFGVTDNSEDEIWSKSQSHKTNPKGKENGNIENTYKIPKGTLQYAPEDTKAFIPITKVKQGFQNITKPTPLPPVSKVTESPPVSKAAEKTVEDLKPVASQPIVESFTPNSSTGTLEWVRATMVTHPFFQVTNLPVESSTTDEHTASLVVRKSNGTQDGSEGIATLEPVLTVDPPRDLLETPPISQQGTMLPPRIIKTTSVYPVTTDVPQVSPLFPLKQFMTPLATTRQIVTARQNTLPSHTPQKTTMATAPKFLPAKQRTWHPPIQTKTTTAFTGGHHIPTTYGSIARTEVHHSVSATTSQISPDIQSTLPSPARTKIKTATTRQIVTARQSTLPSHTPQKTTMALAGAQNIHTTYESIARTEEPYSVSATTPKFLPAKQRTRRPRIQTKATTAFTGGQHIPTTYGSIARTEVHHSVSATTSQISPDIQSTLPSAARTKIKTATTRQIVTARQSTLPSHTPQKTTMAFAGAQNIHTTYESIARTEEPYSVSATATKFLPAKQRTRRPHIQTKATTAFTGGQHIPTTYGSITRTEVRHSVSATTSQIFPDIQSTPERGARTKIKTVFPGRQHISTTQDSNIKTADPYSIFVPNETASFHPKPFLSTEAPSNEADSTESNSEISTTEAPHTYEPETFTLASNEKKIVQKFSSTSKPKPTTASKKTRVSPMQYKTPLPEKTHPTSVLKDMQPIQLIEETSTIVVPSEIQKHNPKKAHSTESSSLPVDPSTSHILPIDDLGVDIFEHTKRPLEPNKTEKASTLKFDSATKSPATSIVVTREHIKKMPINIISLQILVDPTVAMEKTEIQTTPPPIPKTTQSNKMLHSKPVPNTTQRPYQPTTQRPESPPHSKPVPTQKVSTPTTKKPKPTPRIHAEPASTGTPKDTPKPSHVNQGTTLVPYRLQHSSSRPKTSFRPRTRPPAYNGTTQGPIRSRPTGEFNWLPGTVPGGKIHDNAKILGVRRNISMETNSTGKRTFSVSSPPLPPVRPTSIRRRIHPSNVTGRPGFSVSSPPLLPVRPTAIRRKPPTTNVTGRPEKQGGNLIPSAPSAAKPECPVICIKSPMKQPTLPDQEEDLVLSTVFSTVPKSDTDALGKDRDTGPHILYKSKNDTVPCSITDTLKYFSTEEESANQEATSAPQNPPTNLTIYTVEGCPSFVVLNWEKPDNDTVTEYNVISKENGGVPGKDQSIITTNQTHSTVENLKPDTNYEFQVIPKNPLGEGPSSATVEFNTESADPRISEPVTGGKDAIWTEIKFKADFYSDCKGKQYVKRTWYKKFVGIQLCNSLRYKIYLSDTLSGTFYNIGDQSGFGEDHCQFVDSFLEGRTGEQLQAYQLTAKKGFYRSVRQQPVEFGEIGGQTHIGYVHWYECGISIPGKW